MLLRMIFPIIMGLTLAGCGWFTTRGELARIERDLGVPVVETGRVSVSGRQVIFFRYQKGTQCGTGHLSSDGGAGWGMGPCQSPPLAMPSVGTSSVGEGSHLVSIDGQVGNAAVTRVTVTLENGSEIPAQVSGGMYFAAYIAPGGPVARPPGVKLVQGFDKDGNLVEEAK